MYVALLQACAKLKDVERGLEIHAEMARRELLQADPYACSALLHMYVKCGFLGRAQDVLVILGFRDVVVWNMLIAGYAEHGYGANALSCYEQMRSEGVQPDAVTFVCTLKACGNMGNMQKGVQMHAEIDKRGLLSCNLIVGNALIDMYVKFGLLAKAVQVFQALPIRDVVSWTSLLAGYVQHGQEEEALKCYEGMRRERISVNAHTFVCILKACGSIGAIEKGCEVHCEIERLGLQISNDFVGSALVDMYSKCGLHAKARQVFNRLRLRKNVVLWTTLITGCAEHGHSEEALDLLEKMELEGLLPNDITFMSGLKACAHVGAINKGRGIHAEIERKGSLGKHLGIGTSLVDMYANCGLLQVAQQVFDKLPSRDYVSWNALISGYAQSGHRRIIFTMFDKMVAEGIRPNFITFVIILNACSKMGLFDKGHMYFEAMSKEYGIVPLSHHLACMVDLLARRGYIDHAATLAQKFPFCPSLDTWHSLVRACGKWRNMDVGGMITRDGNRKRKRSEGP